ncbi:MAG: hypothetical protein U5L95_03145 [Candidatus Saccharibacteria bacterium]|nr:hypothetical protein [Candidatus Saccharibacteria bacterium]
MGEVIEFPGGEYAPVSSIISKHRSKVEVSYDVSEFLLRPSHEGFNAETFPNGTIQAGDKGLTYFCDVFGSIEVGTPPPVTDMETYFSSEEPEETVETLQSDWLYAIYYAARTTLQEGLKRNNSLHSALGALATWIYKRQPGASEPGRIRFDSTHLAENYLIGKYAATFAARTMEKTTKAPHLAREIHSRAFDKSKFMGEISDDEARVLSHFSNDEVIIVITESGISSPDEAVARQLG